MATPLLSRLQKRSEFRLKFDNESPLVRVRSPLLQNLQQLTYEYSKIATLSLILFHAILKARSLPTQHTTAGRPGPGFIILITVRSVQVTKLIVALLCLTCVLTIDGHAQKKLKPWQEWSKKDAESILNDSPWARTQVDTDLSEMTFRPQAAPDAKSGSSNADPVRDARGGATNQATTVTYRIRFLSAKPIRQAFARFITPDQADARFQAHMKDFVDRQFDQWIAVIVGVESRDQRLSAPAMQAFASATTDSLKNSTYLERKDGKRLYLHMYQPPTSDGLGAKFIFERIIDERPFLKEDSGEVRFVTEAGKVKLNTRFRVDEMKYDGRLEY